MDAPKARVLEYSNINTSALGRPDYGDSQFTICEKTGNVMITSLEENAPLFISTSNVSTGIRDRKLVSALRRSTRCIVCPAVNACLFLTLLPCDGCAWILR